MGYNLYMMGTIKHHWEHRKNGCHIYNIYMGYMPSYEDLRGLSLCFCRGQNVLFKPLECVRNNLWDCKMKKQLWW